MDSITKKVQERLEAGRHVKSLLEVAHNIACKMGWDYLVEGIEFELTLFNGNRYSPPKMEDEFINRMVHSKYDIQWFIKENTDMDTDLELLWWLLEQVKTIANKWEFNTFHSEIDELMSDTEHFDVNRLIHHLRDVVDDE